MNARLPISQLVEDWLEWAAWIHDQAREGEYPPGDFELAWCEQERPEQAWQAILAIVADPRAEPHLWLLTESQLQYFLENHGKEFIERVESAARTNSKFALMLGGLWGDPISKDVWERVQAVWDRTNRYEKQ
jgi:hypothetical protein